MIGPFGTTAGRWTVPVDMKLPTGANVWSDQGDVWAYTNKFDRPTHIARCGEHSQSASEQQIRDARAIAQVPAMLELIDAMRAGPFAPVNWVEMARAIARELEEN